MSANNIQGQRSWAYAHPTRVVWGQDAIQDLPTILEQLGSRGAVAITGCRAAEQYGYAEGLKAALAEPSLQVFDRIEPEPTHASVLAATRFVERTGAEVVIALGGGSVLDAAKMVTCIAGTGIDDIAPFMDRAKAIDSRRLRLIAIPTTAGTGSEVTPFSVLTNEVTGEKKSLPSPYFYPDVAVVSPRFLTTVPQKVAGDVGLDALAHAYEAVWSKNSNPVSDALAFKAIDLITRNFASYYADRGDAAAAAAMSEGSTIAGLAFSNTLTAGCHGLSYPIGKLFGLSHGASCAMTLHLVAALNKESVYDKFVRLAGYLGLEGPDAIPESIADLRMLTTTIPTLRQLGATSDDLQRIADGAFQPLLRNNPVELTEERIVALLTPEIQ